MPRTQCKPSPTPRRKLHGCIICSLQAAGRENDVLARLTFPAWPKISKEPQDCSPALTQTQAQTQAGIRSLAQHRTATRHACTMRHTVRDTMRHHVHVHAHPMRHTMRCAMRRRTLCSRSTSRSRLRAKAVASSGCGAAGSRPPVRFLLLSSLPLYLAKRALLFYG